MKKNILSGFLLCLFTLLAQGQSTFQPKQEGDFANKGIVYNKELAFDLRLHTNGLSFGVNVGKLKTYYLTRYYHFGIGELKHHKENRSNLDRSNTSGRISRSFVYGKQNNLFVLRAGMGEKRYFSEKAKRKGVAVGLSYEGGFSLGMLKPYYLELLAADTPPFTSTVSVKYSEAVKESFLDPWNIFGSSGWTKGLGEIAIAPGIHTQVAVHVDWGAFDEYVKAIEAGIMVDVYFRDIPIMVEVDGVENQPYFINLFLNLQLGKRK